MQKLSFPLALVALAISIISFFYFKNSNQQVYVDVNKLLDGYDRTAVVRADFEKKAASMNANVDSLLSTWQKELKVYEKERAGMSKKELALRK